jgi:hypothetical protein
MINLWGLNKKTFTYTVLILTLLVLTLFLVSNQEGFLAQSRIPQPPVCVPDHQTYIPGIKTIFICDNVEPNASIVIPNTKCLPLLATSTRVVTCTETSPGSAGIFPSVKLTNKLGAIVSAKLNYIGTPESPSLSYISRNSFINGKDPINYFAILDTETKNLQHYKGDTIPLSLASVVKIFVAVGTVMDLQEGKYTLDTPTPLNKAIEANGDIGKTVRENLNFMLSPSSNTATNILIEKNGGFVALNTKLKKIGLTVTSVNCYLSLPNPNCPVANASTMRELVIATNWIREGTSIFHQAAKDPMIKTKYTHNHTNRIFNKTGLNSSTIADIGVFSATFNGKKKEYVFAVLATCVNKDCYLYDSLTEPPAGKVATTNLTEKTDPTSKAIQWAINDLQVGFALINGEK